MKWHGDGNLGCCRLLLQHGMAPPLPDLLEAVVLQDTTYFTTGEYS